MAYLYLDNLDTMDRERGCLFMWNLLRTKPKIPDMWAAGEDGGRITLARPRTKEEKMEVNLWHTPYIF